MTAAKQVWHKGCFKCEVCEWQLTYANMKNYEDKIYCNNHFPVTGFGDNSIHKSGTIDTSSQSISRAQDAPKLGVVNEQVRGTGSSSVGMDSFVISSAMSAPKLDTTKSEVRGSGSSKVGMDSFEVSNAMQTPKLDVATGIDKGAFGKK